MFLAHVAQGRRWVGDMLAKFIKSSQIKDRVVDIWALSGRKCIFDISFDNTLVRRVVAVIVGTSLAFLKTRVSSFWQILFEFRFELSILNLHVISLIKPVL